MDIKTIPAVIVGVMVALVLVGATMPIWADTLASEDTFTNKGYYTLDKVASDADFVLTWDYTDPNIIDISGVKIDMSTCALVSNKSYTIFGGDNFIIRYIWGTQPYIQYFGDQSVTPAFMQATIATSSKLTATVSGGSIVFATDNASYPTPATLTLSENTYCINPAGTGAYTMKKMDDTAYIEKNTDIIVLDGISSLYVNDVGIFATGTINDDLDAITFRGTSTYDVTFGDFVYTTSNVDNYVDLVKLEKVDFTASQNSTDYDITYSYFIVPSEVTAERSVYMGGPLGALVSIIPLLIIAGLVIGAVTWFMLRKG